jgi:hypothetical protein
MRKSAYIAGVYDAMILEHSDHAGGGARPKEIDLVIDRMTYGEIAKVVDTFYADPANVRGAYNSGAFLGKRKVSG